jgi:hypothetical protein
VLEAAIADGGNSPPLNCASELIDRCRKSRKTGFSLDIDIA